MGFHKDLPMKPVFTKIEKSQKSRFWGVDISSVESQIWLKIFLGVELALISSSVEKLKFLKLLGQNSGVLKIAILASKGSPLTKVGQNSILPKKSFFELLGHFWVPKSISGAIFSLETGGGGKTEKVDFWPFLGFLARLWPSFWAQKSKKSTFSENSQNTISGLILAVELDFGTYFSQKCR